MPKKARAGARGSALSRLGVAFTRSTAIVAAKRLASTEAGGTGKGPACGGLGEPAQAGLVAALPPSGVVFNRQPRWQG